MKKQELTYREQSLLQRHFDGELVGEDAAAAKVLLENSAVARIFLASLEELALAVRESEALVWESARAVSSAEIAEIAARSSALSERPLAELAPLLERFFDGEVDEVEGIFVAALVDEREDVAAYLEQLDELRGGLREIGAGLGADVDFGDFWSGVDARLGDVVSGETAETVGEDSYQKDSYQAGEHAVLLYRFHDEQVDDAERARVEGWLAANQPEVKQTIAALAELHIAVNASVELAQDRVDLSAMWSGVEARLDAQEQEESAAVVEGGAESGVEVRAEGNVVSLASARSERREFARPAMAFAAAVTLLLLGGLLADRFFSSGTVIIQERTVVIVDSVEHGPGVRVDINSPLEHVGQVGEDDEDFPTVIWLLDADEEAPADSRPGQPGGPI